MCFTSSIAYKCSTCNYSYIECARDSKKRMALVMRWLDWRLETEHILISLSKRSRMSLNPLLIDNGKPQVIFAPGGDTYGLNGDLALWCQRVVSFFPALFQGLPRCTRLFYFKLFLATARRMHGGSFYCVLPLCRALLINPYEHQSRCVRTHPCALSDDLLFFYLFGDRHRRGIHLSR